jgi:hypothetical protein
MSIIFLGVDGYLFKVLLLASLLRSKNTFRNSLFYSVADPGSGAFLTPGSGMGKKSRSGSGMNNPDHIS